MLCIIREKMFFDRKGIGNCIFEYIGELHALLYFYIFSVLFVATMRDVMALSRQGHDEGLVVSKPYR